MQDETLFERSGFKVTGKDDGSVIFATVGTVGLSGADAAELSQVLAAWIAA